MAHQIVESFKIICLGENCNNGIGTIFDYYCYWITIPVCLLPQINKHSYFINNIFFIFGHILFIIYINDLSQETDGHCIMFADDPPIMRPQLRTREILVLC